MKKYIFLIIALDFTLTQSNAQNTGIGTSVPTGRLDINGDLILRSQSINLTSAVTSDLDVNTSKYNHYKLTGPLGNFAISGLRAGVQDRMVTLYNRNGTTMQLYNNDLNNPTAANRIVTGTNATLDIYNGGSVTLKYDATLARWEVVGSHKSSLNYYGATWGLYGNSGNNFNAFIGTTDAQPLRFGVNNGNAGIIDSASANTALGSGALRGNTVGTNNVAIGSGALYYPNKSSRQVAIGDSAMFGQSPASNQVQAKNTAVGSKSLFKNYWGYSNTAIGFESLLSNNTGAYNIAVGTSSLTSNITGSFNAAIGDHALERNTTGFNNTSTGAYSLNAHFAGDNNTANGYYALAYDTTGANNTALGTMAMYASQSGKNNTAAGYYAMLQNTTGSSNIAIGVNALQNNTSISNLVAIGDSALFNNGFGADNATQGSFNSAVGSKALFANTLGTRNTALGFQTLTSNSVGNDNTAIGKSALTSNTSGFGNTATGLSTLSQNTVGHDNTANGAEALIFSTGSGNTAFGSAALYNVTTGFVNTGIGFGTLVASGNLSNATAIGAYAVAGCSNCMVLGSINGVNTATSNTKVAIGTTTPLVDLHIKQSNETYPVNGGGMRFERQTTADYWDIGADNGSDFDFALNGSAKAYINHVSGAYTVASDFRLKKDIKLVGTVLPSIMHLQPKTYHYKDNQNGDPLSYGLIAQEVEKLFPDFVTTKGADGMKAIAYQNLNVIAIKAIQEQQTQIEALQKQNADLLIRLEKLEAK